MLNKNFYIIALLMAALSYGYGAQDKEMQGIGASSSTTMPDTNNRSLKRCKVTNESSEKQEYAVYPPVYNPQNPFNLCETIDQINNNACNENEFVNIVYHCVLSNKITTLPLIFLRSE